MRVGGSDAAGGQFDDLREVIEGSFAERFTKQLGGLLLVVLRVVERPGRRGGLVGKNLARRWQRRLSE